MSSKPILSLQLGFKCSETGHLTIKVVSSRFPILQKSFNGVAQLLLGKMLKLDELSVVTKSFLEDKSSDPYFTKMARAFNLSIAPEDEAQLKLAIPKTGPVLVLMNHPANGRETIALAGAISKIRPDLKIALTALLRDYPNMEDNAICLDLGTSVEAKNYNLRQREAMNKWIHDGGVLLAHPAGEVSSYRHTTQTDYPVDPRWRIGIGKLIEANPEVQVVPAFLDGKASDQYHKINNIESTPLRDSISPIFHVRELAKGRNQEFGVNFGSIILGKTLLDRFEGNLPKIMQYLRSYTYALKGRFEKKVDGRLLEKIADGISKDLIKQDLAKMKILAEERGLQVLMAQGKDIPHVLQELGRLREMNFRLIGEGSGKAVDIDQFDPHYHHIVMYSKDLDLIMGQYRLAFSDEVIAEKGLKGFYNLSLFEYSELMKKDFKNSIELGRSFVNVADVSQLPDSEKRTAALFLPLVWRGIAKILEENPRYTHLIGPVSISNQFSDISKKIIVDFLSQNYSADKKVAVVPRLGFEAKRPLLPQIDSIVPHIADINDLFQVIKDIDGTELPSLIKSYGKLGARYLSFSFDQSFNTVDGMIVVNILQSNRQELAKYFSEDGLKKYLKFHNAE